MWTEQFLPIFMSCFADTDLFLFLAFYPDDGSDHIRLWNAKIYRRPEKVIELDLILLTVWIIMETNE
jgi:hypothetical protein